MAEAVIDAAALQDLNGGFGGQLLRAEDPGYDDARKVFNAMIDRRPELIARCTGVSDVMAAVRLARRHDLPVAIRGGGHAVSGHAVSEGGVVIDVSPMKGVRVDRTARTAWAQAGLNWGELDRETQAFGLAVTGGRVPDTGVAGLTLGGGSGWIERKCGFTVDNVLAFELVTADGEFVVASADEHPDLYWALRGGGGNFGVVTAFEFRLHEVGPTVLGGMLLFPIERAAELMRSYRDLIAGASSDFGGACAVLCAPPEEFVPEPARGKPVFGVIVCHVGAPEEGEELAATLRDWGPLLDLVGPMPYTALQQLIAAGNPPGMQHYWKAGFLDQLTDDAIDTFVSHAADVASPLTANIMIPLGGAVAEVDDDATPLGFRDAGWNYHILAQWPDPFDSDRQIAWTRRFDEAMASHARTGVYVNFVADPPENILEASFGPEKYARLVAVKDRYDPDNVFRFNQNIAPTAARPA